MGSGGKKRFKWYLKSEHTDRRTHGNTDEYVDLLKASAQRANALKILSLLKLDGVGPVDNRPSTD